MNLDEIQLPQRPPELAELESRRARIRKQRHMVEHKLRAAEEARSRAAVGGEDEITRLASELASGARDSISRVALPEELNHLRDRLAAFLKAEGELRRQMATWTERHNRATADVVQPVHRRAVRKIWEALQALVEANAAEMAIRDAMPGLQIPRSGFPNVGRFDGTSAPAERWRDYALRIYPDLEEDDPDTADRKPRLVPRRGKASRATGKAAPAALVPAPMTALPKN